MEECCGSETMGLEEGEFCDTCSRLYRACYECGELLTFVATLTDKTGYGSDCNLEITTDEALVRRVKSSVLQLGRSTRDREVWVNKNKNIKHFADVGPNSGLPDCGVHLWWCSSCKKYQTSTPC